MRYRYSLAVAGIALGLGLMLLLSPGDARGKPAATAAKGQVVKTIKVGPARKYSRLSQALRDARDGDVIEIDSAGKYDGDVCLIRPSGLTIRGVGKQRAKFPAAGKHYGGKAIWVIRGDNATVENIEFSGARVRDRNGAGIRAEGKGLTLRNCRFHDCEDGILGGRGVMLIEYCEFSACGLDGQSHNLYIGSIDKLIFRYNYSHHAKVGHLLKSSARENHILYNYLTDGKTGSSSYVINLPNGGRGFFLGDNPVPGAPAPDTTPPPSGGGGGEDTGAPPFLVNKNPSNKHPPGGFFYQRKK
ncbi:MAG: right-handed parallel beta-helix repeat-containing protein, partial [Planctomycetes bacterium]|nr:right-handed parallel beta-helix repeat-containing protein [Planctomycetota bacterium]